MGVMPSYKLIFFCGNNESHINNLFFSVNENMLLREIVCSLNKRFFDVGIALISKKKIYVVISGIPHK